METGVVVLGMHRSGTSAATRVVNLLGASLPREDDIVPPSAKNPKGYWESISLIRLNMRILAALGSDMRAPARLADGWERDLRLLELREEASRTFPWTFPLAPWVWKDPRTCLTMPFWRDVLDQAPLVVLVNRNPLEIVASSVRAGRDHAKLYVLALWERYLREAFSQVRGLPVLVTRYDDLLADPLAWCERTRLFLGGRGLEAVRPSPEAVLDFVDGQLRHVRSTRDEFLADGDVSASQRELFLLLESMDGAHESLAPLELPRETWTTDAFLAERRRALRAQLARTQDRGARRLWKGAWRLVGGRPRLAA
jgi:hypothetical protein